ncbi:Helix-turn-helix domain-containing protein [Spirosomataceae bacterium TFI 002]|nr:Helix-turn-helix domain-containing protein [Spirosomataceae bacterium TFI 002]
MQKVVNIDNIYECNSFNNHKTLHPLATVIDFSKAYPRDWGDTESVRFNYGLYSIFLKDVKCGDLIYGRHHYDYQEGTLVFFAPGQVVEIENSKEPYQPMGYGLFFHPDFLNGTSLGKNIGEYKFFNYRSNEALHVSQNERQMILDSLAKIEFELKQPIDKHSKKLITANIELFLNYCERFYDRQFITRENVNNGILSNFEEMLNAYFLSESPQTIGLPSVTFFAQELNLSANYFGDLIKKETGKSAKDYILNKTIQVAKSRVFETNKTVSEIAYELGFKYPQHFSRVFKQRVGKTPNEYRNLN